MTAVWEPDGIPESATRYGRDENGMKQARKSLGITETEPQTSHLDRIIASWDLEEEKRANTTARASKLQYPSEDVKQRHMDIEERTATQLAESKQMLTKQAEGPKLSGKQLKLQEEKFITGHQPYYYQAKKGHNTTKLYQLLTGAKERFFLDWRNAKDTYQRSVAPIDLVQLLEGGKEKFLQDWRNAKDTYQSRIAPILTTVVESTLEKAAKVHRRAKDTISSNKRVGAYTGGAVMLALLGYSVSSQEANDAEVPYEPIEQKPNEGAQTTNHTAETVDEKTVIYSHIPPHLRSSREMPYEESAMPEPEPRVIQHVVQPGENWTTITKKYNPDLSEEKIVEKRDEYLQANNFATPTEWHKLQFSSNNPEGRTNPDLIIPGSVYTITVS